MPHLSSAHRIVASAAAIVLVLLLAARRASAQDFEIGYNQAWIDGAWGRDLTADFDAEAWRRVFRRTREGGGTVVRVWLFEGRELEGVVWDGHRPASVDPRMLDAIRSLAAMAVEEGVRLYWTATDGNWPWETRGLAYDRAWNVANDRFGYGQAFRHDVLGPVIDAIGENPDAVYAFDIVNEVQGSVRKWLFARGWEGARVYIRETAAFLHERAPWMRVTASSGHHTSRSDILDGRFDGLGLDFFDVHVYDDGTRVPDGDALVAHARRRGIPIIVGELGQRRSEVDDELQARVATGLARDAHRRGFAAAMMWRLEDSQQGGRRFAFYEGDRARPAVAAMRRLASELAPEPPAEGPLCDPDEPGATPIEEAPVEPQAPRRGLLDALPAGDG